MWIALFALAMLLAIGEGAPFAAPTGSAAFDWSMPDRYAGSDGNGDGLLDSFAPDGPLEVAPDGFRVDFVGSGADACGGANTTVWSIEGIEVTAADPRVVGGDPGSCAFSYEFDDEGTYEVSLEGRDGSGETVALATHLVRVQDFLVVSIGDSIASGEGNPDVPGGAARWQDELCHRSALAGPARAARALELADPRTSVTFVHLACSGASITEGLLGGYEGIVPAGPKLPPQVDALEDLVGDRELDALLVSIGANDVEFSGLVFRCFVGPACDQVTPGSAARRFQQLLPLLPGALNALDARLDQLDLEAARTYFSEYPDPTHDSDGTFCGTPPSTAILDDHPAAGSGVLGIVGSEAAWASTVMLASLNTEVAAAAGRHGRQYVGGIAGQFVPHGYCAADHWVVRYLESKAAQGDEYGTLHPNGAGQGVYGDRLAGALAADFYAGGNLMAPRRPDQRLEVQGRLSGEPEFLDVVEPVEAGETVTVRARINGADNVGRSLAFSVDGPGSISATAGTTDTNGEATFTYTAPDPATDERARVIATFVAGGETFRDTVGITLEAPDVQVTIAPMSATLAPGDTRQFGATVLNASDTSVTWSAAGGSITQSGLYTAGTTPGVYPVTATSVEDPTKSATASVTISSASVFGVYEGTMSDTEGNVVPVSRQLGNLVTVGRITLFGETHVTVRIPLCHYSVGITESGGSFTGDIWFCEATPPFVFPEGGEFSISGSVGGGTLVFSAFHFVPDTGQVLQATFDLTKCSFQGEDPTVPFCS